ncbi:hypothetical protein NPIL_37671 [Nephila pilipes]|uniref:Uncharacterized protein n=1 Tax=Nephila pilipes TaxID=299642 RepID=A0A8X6QR75_NEPPI|nr:hypothetical protein NPIL_37671 [Nephila pilipes]
MNCADSDTLKATVKPQVTRCGRPVKKVTEPRLCYPSNSTPTLPFNSRYSLLTATSCSEGSSEEAPFLPPNKTITSSRVTRFNPHYLRSIQYLRYFLGNTVAV